MDKNLIIVVTGAAGFIGSCLVGLLNEKGFENLILVDDFKDEKKAINLKGKKFTGKIEREHFFEWLKTDTPAIKFIYHLGARTDTTEFDYSIHQHFNVDYTQAMWQYCVDHNVPLVYASSAATYGSGELGYDDDHAVIEKLQPLNPYGVSKNEVDKWVLEQFNQQEQPPFWAGLKFFNVYGPNENHKGRMASVIYHSYLQIQQNGYVKLFKSYKDNFADGEQLRDFIYVKDVVQICYWLMDAVLKNYHIKNGIYNIGTGKARSFNDLVSSVFSALEIPTDIRYIDMPEDIKEKYQYYTQANTNKIEEAGYTSSLFSLEAGVEDYVKNYLVKGEYY